MAFTRIVRIQRPVVPADGPWLVYDEQRVHEQHQEPDPYMRAMMGGRMGAYFWATWSADRGWMIKRRVREKLNW
jgi:hypothetical protein